MSGQQFDGNIILLIGLVLATIGAVLLGIDALGIQDLVGALQGEEAHIASLGFVAYVNTTILFLLVDAWAFAVASFVTHRTLLVLIVCPFAYFVWRVLVRITRFLYWDLATMRFYKPLGDAVNSLPQPIGCLAFLVALLPAAIIVFALFLLSAIIEFGVILPSYAVSEFVIKPRLQAALERLAGFLEGEQRWHLKRVAFTGMLFLAFGFIYQFAGTLVLILSTNSGGQTQ